MNRIVLTEYNGQLSFSLWEKDRPAELALYEQEPECRLGDIYLARVQDIVPGIRAAFVWLTPRQRAYLPLEQAPSKLRCGDELPVQIVKEAQKTKDPVATGHISLAGRLAVLVTDSCRVCVSAKISDTAWRERIGRLLEPLLAGPRADGTAASSYGFVIRTGAFQASDDEIYREAKALADRYRRLCREAATHVCYTRLWQSEPPWLTRLYKLTGVRTEIVTDLPEVHETCQAFLHEHGMNSLFSLRLYTDTSYPLKKLYSLETVIQEALAKRVWLRSGGYLIIEPTEAMVVIDVNTGKAPGGRTKEETVLRLNLEAAAEIARQIRLRNLSGMILIDFIDMKKEEHQSQVMQALKEAAREDPVGVSVVDITKLGIVECTRRKTARPLYEQLNRNA